MNARLLAVLLLVHGAAHAQDRASSNEEDARDATPAGELLPVGVSATHRARLGKLRTGYDTSASTADVQAEASAALTSWLALSAGASYDGSGAAARPYALGHLQVLRQAAAAVDLSAFAGIETPGFNTVPAIVTGLSLGRRFETWLLQAQVGYAQAAQGNERSGSAQLATLWRASSRLQFGAEARAAIDLERDADEPWHEPDWRALGGPLLTSTWGNVALSIGGGPSALRRRAESQVRLGGMSYAAIAAPF